MTSNFIGFCLTGAFCTTPPVMSFDIVALPIYDPYHYVLQLRQSFP